MIKIIFGMFAILVAAFIVAMIIAGLMYWPPGLSLVLDGMFWVFILMALACFGVIAYLYYNGGATDAEHFFVGMLLIFASSIMYAAAEYMIAEAPRLEPAFRKSYPSLIALFVQNVTYMKNIVSFGFAALGASVCANVISKRYSSKKT